MEKTYQSNTLDWSSFTSKHILVFLATLRKVFSSFKLYFTLYLGQAELAEIPEGYQPLPHEYLKVMVVSNQLLIRRNIGDTSPFHTST